MTGTKPLALLHGVRIVAFTQWLFGPAATQYLADMGADVIKVEPPGGSWERKWAGGDTFVDGVSACFLATHRNVRSVSLDLKSAGGQEAARRLVETADIVVENYRPGVMKRFGLDFETVRASKPDIIYASASGYGTDEGPYSSLPGQDLLIQALTGMIWVGSQVGQMPRPAGAAVVDQHAGLLLATGILGALVHRERTGAGQKVDVTMMEASLDLQLEPVVYHMNGGQVVPPHTGIGSAFHEAPYGVYEVADGYVVLSLNSVATLSNALGNPASLDGLDDPGIVHTRKDQIYSAIAEVIRVHERDALVEKLRERGVWCGPVLNYDEMLSDPGIMHLAPFWEVEGPQTGHVKLLKPPIRFSSGDAVVVSPPPSPGQHSREVLEELGFTPAEVQELLAREGQ